MLTKPDRQETSNTYVGIVHVFTPFMGEKGKPVQFRVATCRDGIQWLLQRRRKSSTAPWASESFCRTRAALIRNLRERRVPYVGELDHLPERL